MTDLNRRDLIKAGAAAGFASQYLCPWPATPLAAAESRHLERRYEGPLITCEELDRATSNPRALVQPGERREAIGVEWGHKPTETMVCYAAQRGDYPPCLGAVGQFTMVQDWSHITTYLGRQASNGTLLGHCAGGLGLLFHACLGQQSPTECWDQLKPIHWRESAESSWPEPSPHVLVRSKSPTLPTYLADRTRLALMLTHQLRTNAWQISSLYRSSLQLLTRVLVYRDNRAVDGRFKLDLEQLAPAERWQFDAILMAYATLGGFEPNGRLRRLWGMTNDEAARRFPPEPYPFR